jgi:hypothetical protein
VWCQLVPAAGLETRSCPWACRFDSGFLFRFAARPVLSAPPRNPPGLATARLPLSNAWVLDSCIEDLADVTSFGTPRRSLTCRAHTSGWSEREPAEPLRSEFCTIVGWLPPLTLIVAAGKRQKLVALKIRGDRVAADGGTLRPEEHL